MSRDCDILPVTSSSPDGTATIKCSTVADHNKVKQILTDLNIEFVSYQLPSLRRREFALRGTFKTISDEAIQRELAARGLPIIAVERIFSTKFNF
jgi:hypothetical protein